jgi:hypothetical protein
MLLMLMVVYHHLSIFDGKKHVHIIESSFTIILDFVFFFFFFQLVNMVVMVSNRISVCLACFAFSPKPFCLIYAAFTVNQQHKLQWNVKKIDLEEGRRFEAVCRSDVDASTLRLEVARHNGRQRESAPLGLSFSNGYLSLGAVTKQDNGLEFICSSGDASDTLTLNVLSSSTLCFFFFFFFPFLSILFQQKYSMNLFLGNGQDASRGYYDGGASAGGYGQYGGEQQQGGQVEVTVEPNDATISQGEKVTLTCSVKGAEQYTVTWGKYAHDTSLPNYARVCILNKQAEKISFSFYSKKEIVL